MQQAIETRSLQLRPLRLQYKPRLAVLANNKQVSDTLLHIPYPFTEADSETMVKGAQQGLAEGSAYHFGTLRGSDLIGVASLIRTDEPGTAYLVYWIGVSYWGQGYGTEAAQAMVDYGFRTLDLQCITAKHAPWNTASAKILQKVGMTFQGIKPKAVFKWGQWLDSSNWSMTASDQA